MTEKKLYEALDALAAALPEYAREDLVWVARLLVSDTSGRFAATVKRWTRDGGRGDASGAHVR